ncbi:hypothetical protein OXPF_23830 [Oxobacter pfennigii]|uniref:LUD domain-containing protein n=1 Tax=Oxobacter pfennigii TaxID=36849 RepID=A0A0P8YWV9_9CLOT|nr:lactate utilization protein [Oxobacter pfennigii]KPU44215.1 hypothetical protein OXPF_23830 [Oxobacter pfennigii]
MDNKVLKTIESLEKNKFSAKYFETSNEAVDYLLSKIPSDASVGIGGSMTVKSLLIPEKLKDRGNKVLFHWLASGTGEMNSIRKEALNADFYLSSTNALTMEGKLVNIDGAGNRVAGMFSGPKNVFIVCGVNKITENTDDALKRVKSIVHLNTKRLNLNTPCARTEECHDCKVSQRICNITAIIDYKPSLTDIEVIIINEDLGF